MIKSMTGYGGAKGASGKIEISIEVKSVNSRHFDCSVKLPRGFASFEEPLKALVTGHISRGKIDVYLTIDTSNADDVELRLNRPLAEAYIEALRALAGEYDLRADIAAVDLTRIPDIFSVEKQETDLDKLYADTAALLENALAAFDAMRGREGERLLGDITARLDEIERLTALAEEASPKIVAEYREKLEKRLAEMLGAAQIDEQRIVTEAAIFADRVAINEETVRLRSHISQLRGMLQDGGPVGRKLDFLLQEFNREANTIGSKGNDAEMSMITVDLKAEIEKIREQAQNIE
jgi:uncharacterized protein (TIGR00255 family)